MTTRIYVAAGLAAAIGLTAVGIWVAVGAKRRAVRRAAAAK